MPLVCTALMRGASDITDNRDSTWKKSQEEQYSFLQNNLQSHLYTISVWRKLNWKLIFSQGTLKLWFKGHFYEGLVIILFSFSRT